MHCCQVTIYSSRRCITKLKLEQPLLQPHRPSLNGLHAQTQPSQFLTFYT